MRCLILLLTFLAAGSAAPNSSQRIIGGQVTNINQYPESAILLYSIGTCGHRQHCGGVILNNRSILTVAHCVFADSPARWIVRLGSNYAHYGGSLYNAVRFYVHPSYDPFTLDNNIAIIRTAGISFDKDIVAGRFPGPNYYPADNAAVYAVGWGLYTTDPHEQTSEAIRHVQLRTVNQQTCRQRYLRLGQYITDNMLCAGLLDVGGSGQCYADDGGPLFDAGRVVVGLYSYSAPGKCADATYPGVNVRVSRYFAWLSANR